MNQINRRKFLQQSGYMALSIAGISLLPKISQGFAAQSSNQGKIMSYHDTELEEWLLSTGHKHLSGNIYRVAKQQIKNKP